MNGGKKRLQKVIVLDLLFLTTARSNAAARGQEHAVRSRPPWSLHSEKHGTDQDVVCEHGAMDLHWWHREPKLRVHREELIALLRMDRGNLGRYHV